MAVWVTWLVDAARQAVAGTGKSVIVSPNWLTRGQGGLRVLEIVVGHHTATPESAPGDYPSLNVVQNGRAGLVGLLSQLGLGRSGNVYVIGAGLAYHAGASAYAGYVDLNDESIGIEAEDSGDGRWTDAQLFMYPRLVRACLDYMRRGVDRYASHRTVAVPAGRKSDPAGISDQWMRQQAASVQWGKQEVDVALNDEYIKDPYSGGNETAAAMLGYARIDALQASRTALRVEAKVDALTGALSDDEANILAAIRSIPGGDPNALAAVLGPALAPFIQAGATPAQVEDAVRSVFASAGQAGGTQ